MRVGRLDTEPFGVGQAREVGAGEFGTNKTVRARLWPWLEPFSGESRVVLGGRVDARGQRTLSHILTHTLAHTPTLSHTLAHTLSHTLLLAHSRTSSSRQT